MNYLSPYAHRLNNASLANGFASFDKQFETLFADLPKLFDFSKEELLGATNPTIATRWYENDDAYIVRLDLPGVKRGDIDLTVEDGQVGVAAKRKFAGAGEENENAFEYRKQLDLPEQVNAEKIRASYENGVLSLTLPKAEKAKPRRIDVSFS
ncbi:Hsp20/alpha crystallin family protein [Pelagicoccus sp. SDUM812003]|uniref:Hsp20/alpha crystallin family protein n=1 Tax=Pelagicoccus sp. SDUM812003 TaxID=3041267 RepID=UPI00280DAC85|nr:Hsp20/alpha crystallin family protein [Pelagicoccus sp. SDUM812003]MDQ8202749.1 Hsp20/alpha crystallin family protein [Pelagicoccus sp. SDUM812003]